MVAQVVVKKTAGMSVIRNGTQMVVGEPIAVSNSTMIT